MTDRDRELLIYVCRHGACTPEQLARAAPSGKPFFTSQWACYRRLRALLALRLLTRENTWWHGANVVMTSLLGVQFTRVDLPPARFVPATVEHTLALVDLSEHLLHKHRHSAWLTERELRRDAMRDQRAQGMTTLSPTRPRSPDGMIVLPDQRRFAVELDLTAKRSEVYTRLLSAYAGVSGISGVWWFTPKATIRTRLAAVVREAGMDSFVAVERWVPTVSGPDGRSLEA